MGVVAAEGTTRAELLSALRGARSVDREDQAHDGVIISRVTTRDLGVYWLVTESDVSFPEDIDALERWEQELGGPPWRNRILTTDVYREPHPLLPLSGMYKVHLVHPACPPGRPRRCNCQTDMSAYEL